MFYLVSCVQRYFPDFFPSCYTEKRLNLKRLFSEVERRSEEQEVGSLLDRAVAHPHERGLVRDFSLGKFMSGGSNGGGSGGGGLGSMGYGLFRTNAWGSPSSNTNDDNSSGPAAAQSAGKETGTLLGLNASAMVQAMRWSNLRRAIDKLVQVVQAEEREPAPTPTSVAAEDASSTAESESGAVDSKEDNKAPPVF